VSAAARLPQQILVIKLGALGDFIQAFAPFATIRRRHADARITLLTTAPFRDLAEASGWFDDVWLDDRPAPLRPWRWLALRRRLRGGGFARVYDLQTSDRSGWYFKLMHPGPPEWSGAVAGCSHRHANPGRDRMHTLDRQAEQLAIAGLEPLDSPSLAWLDADAGCYRPDAPYVLIVPGGAAHRPGKRWPGSRFGVLAASLLARGIRPAIVGGPTDTAAAGEILVRCPDAIDLTGHTDLFELAGLARRAAGAVGNDTGPMHLAAALGCPSLVLFSDASDPALCAPRGGQVRILRRRSLSDLPAEEVEANLRLR
jgi:ADP-heptose:LPS heptosyltransferase